LTTPEAAPLKKAGGIECDARGHATVWGCQGVREPLVVSLHPCSEEEQVPPLLHRLQKTRIDDTLDTLAEAGWFSTPELKSGYLQVDLQGWNPPSTQGALHFYQEG
jgi:hypothetical protein